MSEGKPKWIGLMKDRTYTALGLPSHHTPLSLCDMMGKSIAEGMCLLHMSDGEVDEADIVELLGLEVER